MRFIPHIRDGRSHTGIGILLALTLWLVPAVSADEPDEVRIAAGEFRMGTQEATQSEAPVHTVFLDAFFIDRYEVTNEAYRARMANHVPSPQSACDRCPVTRVSWFEAKAHCNAVGKRLPTEAEWEKAARGPQGWNYGFGNRADPEKGHFAKTMRAGALPVEALGLYGYGTGHLSGNVWEWVNDWFDDTYYAASPKRNPKGPPSGFRKSVRGGSWYNAAYYVHAGMRFALKPGMKLDSVGFRCVRDAR